MAATVKVRFNNADRKGAVRDVDAVVGNTLLEVAWAHKIDTLEGACDHCLACSTCQGLAKCQYNLNSDDLLMISKKKKKTNPKQFSAC